MSLQMPEIVDTTCVNRFLCTRGHPYRLRVVMTGFRTTVEHTTVLEAVTEAFWMLAPAVERRLGRRYIRRPGD